jgi:hypothetical protein
VNISLPGLEAPNLNWGLNALPGALVVLFQFFSLYDDGFFLDWAKGGVASGVYEPGAAIMSPAL